MADYKDIFGIGKEPVRTEETENDGERGADALSLFGVERKEEDK